MVRIVLVAVVISLFVSLAGLPPQANAVCCGRVIGDVNCDGFVDSRDARDILKYSAGLLDKFGCFTNSNVDGYWPATSTDALVVLKSDAGLIDHLPPIETFTGTIVQYTQLEGGCLGLDTGSGVIGVWNLDGAAEGDHVRVGGFINDELFFICGLYPVIDNSSVEILP